jgi:hypothetical protein
MLRVTKYVYARNQPEDICKPTKGWRSRKTHRKRKETECEHVNRGKSKVQPNRSCIFVVDGAWTDWEDWTQCTASCGEGATRSRKRACANPKPMFGGRTCTGRNYEKRSCKLTACPRKYQFHSLFLKIIRLALRAYGNKSEPIPQFMKWSICFSSYSYYGSSKFILWTLNLRSINNNQQACSQSFRPSHISYVIIIELLEYTRSETFAPSMFIKHRSCNSI